MKDHPLTRSIVALVLLALLSTLHVQLSAGPMGTAFTYQGRLSDGANAANGLYDLRFILFAAASEGNSVGNTNTLGPVSVSNGLFTVTLDFGANAFDGGARWLEIGVCTNGAGAFKTLAPRQELKPAPYALYTPNATAAQTAGTASAVGAGAVGTLGLRDNAVDSSKIADGTIVGVDLSPALRDSTFWKLLGNAGTTPGVNFLGTTDNQPLELKVNYQRALRLEPNATSPNVVGGFSNNAVAAGVYAGTIGGGGIPGAANTVASEGGTIAGGSANSVVVGNHATIAGGSGHTVGTIGIHGAAPCAAIGGGSGNSVLSSTHATVAGGGGNRIGTQSGAHSCDYSAIGGGSGNDVEYSRYATIAGGQSNSVTYWAHWGTIGGGMNNSNWSRYATIGGGMNNFISSGADMAPDSPYTTIGGGLGNYMNWLCDGATIAGGVGNQMPSFNSRYSAIGGGQSNIVRGRFGSIPGGFQNTVASEGGTVSGGAANAIAAGLYGTISGGSNNTVGSTEYNGFAPYSTIGGGYFNNVMNSSYATVAGGNSNTVGRIGTSQQAPGSVIGGGYGNAIVSSSYATVAGGSFNEIGLQSYEHACNFATIGGGYGNNVEYSRGATIAGGENNTVSRFADFGTIAGGINNSNHSRYATIGGGIGNFIDGAGDMAPDSPYTTIGGGSGNYMNWLCDGATIAGGVANQMPAYYSRYSAIGGGQGNVVRGPYGTIPGGAQAAARNHGQMAYASGQFATNGDAQTSVFVCRGTTTNATMSELFLDGRDARIVVPTNSTWGFDILVTGRDSAGNSAAYQLRGAIKNNAGVTTLVGAPNVTVLGEDVAAWNISVVADNAKSALEVQVSGASATSIRWVASVRTVEVSY